MQGCVIHIKNPDLQSVLGKDQFQTVEEFKSSIGEALFDKNKAIPVKIIIGGENQTFTKLKMMRVRRESGVFGNRSIVEIRVPNLEKGSQIQSSFEALKDKPVGKFSITIPDIVYGLESKPDLDTIAALWLGNYFTPSTEEEIAKSIIELRGILKTFSEKSDEALQKESPAFLLSIIGENGIYDNYAKYVGKDATIDEIIQNLLPRLNTKEPIYGQFENYEEVKDKEKKIATLREIDSNTPKEENKHIFKSFTPIRTDVNDKVTIARQMLIKGAYQLYTSGKEVRLVSVYGNEEFAQPLFVGNAKENPEIRSLTREEINGKQKQAVVAVLQVRENGTWKNIYLSKQNKAVSLSALENDVVMTTNREESYFLDYSVDGVSKTSPQLYLTFSGKVSDRVRESLEKDEPLTFSLTDAGSGFTGDYSTLDKRGFDTSDIFIPNDPENPYKGIPFLRREGEFLQIDALNENDEIYSEILTLLNHTYESESEVRKVINYLYSIVGLGDFSYEGQLWDKPSDLSSKVAITHRAIQFNPEQTSEGFKIASTIYRKKVGSKFYRETNPKTVIGLTNEVEQGLLAGRINIPKIEEGTSVGTYPSRLKVENGILTEVKWAKKEQNSFILSKVKTRLLNVNNRAVQAERYLYAIEDELKEVEELMDWGEPQPVQERVNQPASPEKVLDLIGDVLKETPKTKGKIKFQINKNENKDAVDFNKRKMEGIDYVFSQSPELASIGSKDEYLRYLSTIFKTSKVKDIVYHGTTDNNFYIYDPKEGEYVFKLEKLNENTHFGTLQAAKDRIQTNRNNADSVEVERAKDLIIPVLINSNAKRVEDQSDSNINWNSQIETAKKEGYNSLIYSNIKEDKGKDSYVVFEQEQVHILGSEQDIENFKNFLKTDKKSVEKGLNWLKQVMPNAPVEIVKGLIEGVGKGSFEALKDLIQLSRQYADNKTVYHEVFHRAFAMLPEDRREKLLDEGSKIFGIERGESETTVKYSLEQPKESSVKFQSPNIEYTGDLAIEEKMAEWSEEHLGKGYVAENWFEKLLQDIWNWLHDLFVSKSEIEKVFREINQGRFRNGTLSKTDGVKKYQKSQVQPPIIPPTHLDVVAANILWRNQKFTQFLFGGIVTDSLVTAVRNELMKDPQTRSLIENQTDVWEDIVEQWTSQSNLFKLSELDEEDFIEENGESGTSFQERTEQKFSSLEQAGKYAKALFKTIPAYETVNGEIVRNEDGTPKLKKDRNGFYVLADYTTLWNAVADHVAGAVDIDEVVSKLGDGFLKIPEMRLVRDRIKSLVPKTDEKGNKGTATLSGTLFLKNIEKSFAKYLVPTYVIHASKSEEKGGLFDYQIYNSGKIDDIVIGNFLNTLFRKFAKDNKLDEKGYLDNQLLKIVLDSKLGTNYSNEDVVRFWKEMDLHLPFADMDWRTSEEVASVLKSFTTALIKKVNELSNVSAEELKINVDLIDFISNTQSTSSIVSNGQPFVVSALREKLSHILPYSTSNMTKNAEGENQSNLHNFSSWLLTIKSINENQERWKIDRLENPIAKYSLILQNVRSGRKIEPVNVSGTLVENEGSKEGTVSISMDTLDYVRQELHTLLLKGICENMRAETASSSFGFRVSFGRSYLPLGQHNVRQNAKEVFFNYFKGEIERIWLENKEPKNYGSRFYNNHKSGFTFFHDIIPTVLSGGSNPQEKLMTLILSKDKESLSEIFTNANVRKSFDYYVDLYFDREINRFKNWIKQESGLDIDTEGITHPLFHSIQMREMIKEIGLTNLIETYLLNLLTFHWEETILFHGEIGQFDKIYKRLKSNISNGTPAVISDYTQNYLHENTTDTFSDLYGIKPDYLDDSQKMKSIVIEEDRQDLSDENRENWREALTDSFNRTLQFFGKKDQVSDAQIEEKVNKILSGYSSSVVSDGEGFIHPDAYRVLALSVDSWSLDQENGYIYLILKEKQRHGFTLSQEDIDHIETIEKRLEKEGQFFIFPKLKFQYRGNAKTDQKTNVAVELLDKFALTPLFPDMVRGSEKGEYLFEVMSRNNIAYGKFQSGTKLGTYSADDLNTLVENIKQGIYELQSTHEIDTIFLKEQVKTPDKIKNKSIFGSQRRKLMLSNLTLNGEFMEEVKEFADLWISSQRELAETEKKNILLELGADPESEKPVIDIAKLIELVQEELKKRDLPESYQYLFNNFNEGDIMELSLSPQTASTLIYSILKNRIVKIKYPGGQFVQIPNTLFDRGNNERDLQFYKKGVINGKEQIIPADCKIAFVGDFTNLLNLKEVRDRAEESGIEPNLDILNELLLEDEFRDKYYHELVIYADRIPTQGFNSMDVFRVKEFLPSYLGNCVIPPPQITTKSGSDYDYDKMNIITPSIGFNGRYLTGNDGQFNSLISAATIRYEKLFRELSFNLRLFSSEQLSRTLDFVGIPTSEREIILNILQTVGSKIVDENGIISKDLFVEKFVKEYQKKVQFNKSIEAAEGILLNLINFHRLISPNNTELIVSELTGTLQRLYQIPAGVKVNPDPRLTNALSPTTSYTKWKSVKMKDLLGIGAVSNTFYTLMQLAQMKTNPDFKINKVAFDSNIPIFTVEQQGLSSISEPFAFNENIVDKLEYINQFINLTVDAASDDIAGYTNMIMENTGFIMFLIHNGSTFENALKFIHQPIVYKYHQKIKTKLSQGLDYGDAFNETINELLNIPILSEFGRRSKEKIWIDIRKLMSDGPIKLPALVPLSNIPNLPVSGNQQMILAHYLVGIEQANALREMQSHNNFDTSTSPNYKSSALRESTKKIRESGLFDLEAVESIHNDSVISHLNVHDLFKLISTQVFPIINNEMAVNKAVALAQNIKGDTERFFKTFDNDFLLYVIQNFSDYRENRPYYLEQLENGKLLERWDKLVEKYPTFKDMDIYKRLVPYVDRHSNRINPSFFMGMDTNSEPYNQLIAELRLMLNSNKQDVSDFTKDLLTVGFFQSGYTQSGIYMLKGFPPEFIQSLVKEALTTFNNLTPSAKQEYINDFSIKFLLNRVFEFGKYFTAEYKTLGFTGGLREVKSSFSKSWFSFPNYLTNYKYEKREESKPAQEVLLDDSSKTVTSVFFGVDPFLAKRGVMVKTSPKFTEEEFYAKKEEIMKRIKNLLVGKTIVTYSTADYDVDYLLYSGGASEKDIIVERSENIIEDIYDIELISSERVQYNTISKFEDGTIDNSQEIKIEKVPYPIIYVNKNRKYFDIFSTWRSGTSSELRQAFKELINIQYQDEKIDVNIRKIAEVSEVLKNQTELNYLFEKDLSEFDKIKKVFNEDFLKSLKEEVEIYMNLDYEKSYTFDEKKKLFIDLLKERLRSYYTYRKYLGKNVLIEFQSNGSKIRGTVIDTPLSLVQSIYNYKTSNGKISSASTDEIEGFEKLSLDESLDILNNELQDRYEGSSEFTEEELNNIFGSPVSKQNTTPQTLEKKNIFTVTPIQSADKKAIVKASVSTQYIGFGEGITGSSTELYRQQVSKFANTGNYSSGDVIFVSIGGKRGSEQVRKAQQDKTIREALKAIEAGATLITDNKTYVESSDYNEGEKRLAKNLESKGYTYSEQTVDGQVLGVWKKQDLQTLPSTIDIYLELGNKTVTGNVQLRPLSELKNKGGITEEGINALRNSDTTEHFGNPFDSKNTKGTIRTGSTKESVEKYIDWILNGHTLTIKPINIRSDKTAPNSLGNRLTNPNWYAKDLMDVETVYKANQSKKKDPHLNMEEALKYDMNLMYQLQVQKFRKNPKLIDEINAEGGLEFIKQSSHIVGVKNSRWEGKGMESNFIKVLAKSYETVAKELGKFQENSELYSERRQWILEHLKSGDLKGKPILYYTELGEPSHATALDYLINKYDWNQLPPSIDIYQEKNLRNLYERPDKTLLFEANGVNFYMNEGQKVASEKIEKFLLEVFSKNETDEDRDISIKQIFSGNLNKQFSDVFPKVMYDKMFGLLGRGGTGKTTMLRKTIRNFVNEIKKDSSNKYIDVRVAYIAPTHNAVTMLQEALDINSESTDGVSTIASFVKRNQIPGSENAQKTNDGEDLALLTNGKYTEMLSKGFISPIMFNDIIVVDESSMFSKTHMKDLLNRLNLEWEHYGYVKIPIFLFIGDYRQLGPIEKEKSDFEEGIISATVFSDSSKFVELSQVMRSNSEFFHTVFDSIGLEITKLRNKFIDEGVIDKTLLDLGNYYQLTNKSRENLLVVTEKEQDEIIDRYAQILVENDNPYQMFWVHYNNTEKEITINLNEKVRKKIFEKTGKIYTKDIQEGDIIEFKGSLPIQTVPNKSLGLSKGTIKPRSRYKVKEIFSDEVELKDILEPFKYTPLAHVIVKRTNYVVYNRQGKLRLIQSFDEGTFTIGEYKDKKITVYVQDAKKTNHPIILRYADFKDGFESFLKSSNKTVNSIFKPSYVGSSHTVQGATFNTVVIGEYNILKNFPNISLRDGLSSWYTSLTRVAEKMILIKPFGTLIENNQDEFEWEVIQTNKKENDVFQEDKEIDNCSLGLPSDNEIPF